MYGKTFAVDQKRFKSIVILMIILVVVLIGTIVFIVLFILIIPTTHPHIERSLLIIALIPTIRSVVVSLSIEIFSITINTKMVKEHPYCGFFFWQAKTNSHSRSHSHFFDRAPYPGEGLSILFGWVGGNER